MAKLSTQNAKVALIQSKERRAEDIQQSEITDMVREAVSLTGGLSDIIKDGQFVVIKPNLIGTRHVAGGTMNTFTMLMTNPYKKGKVQVQQTANGMTADWRVAKALVELIREVNPSGKIYIMECSGDGNVKENFARLGYTHENIPGVDRFVGLDETADGYRSVDSKDLVAVDLKDKQLYKKLPKFLNNKYYFDKTYYSADIIISLCCLKNHVNAAITGGIKNVGIGAMPGKIYGNNKNSINRGMTINHAWEPINNFIHDYYIAKPVDFVLTDGLQGLAYGPQCQGAPSYDDAKMNMRLILASKDAVAVDTIHAYIVGVDAEKVKYLKDISKEGLGTMDTSKITVVGNVRVDQVKKQFPGPVGLLGTIYSGPGTTRYSDFDPPHMQVVSAKINNKMLNLELDVESEVKKIELYINGELKEVYTEGFTNILYTISNDEITDDSKIEVLAYDRFLNCAQKDCSANLLSTV